MRAICCIFGVLLACAMVSGQKNFVCYFGSWAVYRSGNGQFDISFIDPNLCTHLIYSFIGIEANGTIKILDTNTDLPASEPGGNLDGYNKFNQLREQNTNLKTLIAVGGWNEGSVKYSEMVASAEARATFVENAVSFLKKYGFDGLDMDWEYPNQRGGVKADKQNFVLLLQELREAFDKEGFLLSAAVGSVRSLAEPSYIISEVSKALHFINLMTYDLNTPSGNKTGHNAPLYPRSTDTDEEKELNVQAAVEYWLSEGADPAKINLGMPLYGHAFTLSNSSNTALGAPATAGTPGPYTQEAGVLSYLEICEDALTNQWQVGFDQEAQVPYRIKGDQWVSYDDPTSLAQKVKLLKDYNLGGAMTWSIESDDFRGICGDKYPLLNAIKDALDAS